MADISWEDGEDVTWEQGEDVSWEQGEEASPASKPIEGLGKEKTFLERAAEMPVEQKPLGERMAQATPTQILKAGAVGLEQAIPAPTTGIAAGVLGAAEALGEGRPLTSEDIQRKYGELSQKKEEIRSEAPGIAEVTELATGSAIPLPTGAGAGVSKAVGKAGEVLESGAGVLEKGARGAAVGSLKATGKQLEKINRTNPEIGKFLLDEGLVKAGQNTDDIRVGVIQARKLADDRLNTTYTNIDNMTQGNTVAVNDIVAQIEATKQGLSRAHTNDALREALDKEVEMLTSRYPNGFLTAREAQEIKTAYGQTGWGQSTLPGARSAQLDRKLSRFYKDALDSAVDKADPSLGAALREENRKSSNLRLAEAILSGKKVPDISMAESAIGVAGAFAHPMGAAVPVVSKQVRTRGSATGAAIGRAGAETLEGASDALKSLASDPMTKDVVDAAVRAVGLPMIERVVGSYGADDPRTKALLTRLAAQGEQQ